MRSDTRTLLKGIVTPYVVATAALSCAVLVLACGREPRRPRKTHIIDRLPSSVTEIAIADDATSYAYVEGKPGIASVVHDGVRGPTFTGAGAPIFSPVTRRLFYWAGSGKDKGYLVADGNRLGGDLARAGAIVFSKDGAHWATAAGTRDRIDGDTRAPEAVVVFANDRELGRYPDASLPTLSADGQHIAYLASGAGATKLIVDGVERQTYAAPTAACAQRSKPRPRRLNPNYWPQFQVRYLFDGSLLIMTQDGDGWGIYRDATRLASYEASIEMLRPSLPEGCQTATAVAAWSLTAAERAPVAAWWERLAGNEERWRMVVDGKPIDDITCAKAWQRQPAEFSADGRHVAYACAVTEPEQRVFLVADGRRYGPYWDMWAYTWADDGAHIAYGAAEGLSGRVWRYYVDGQPRGEAASEVWRPRLAATGRFLWESRPDEGMRGSIGIDHRPIATFDDVIWGPDSLRPRTVTWVIRRGNRITRLDVPID